MFLLSFVLTFHIFSQTPGLIYKSADAVGKLVLDPNNDGFISKTKTGFFGEDVVQSELPFVPLVHVGKEPSYDLKTNVGNASLNIIDTENRQSYFVYYNSVKKNLCFRVRLDALSSSNMSYSVLVDTDKSFGIDGVEVDKNAVPNNLGFEIEINFHSELGLQLFNIDGTVSPQGLFTKRIAPALVSQISYAYTNNNSNPDFFYDFYISVDTLTKYISGLTSNTPIRLALASSNSSSSILFPNSIVDIAGVNDGAYEYNYDFILKKIILKSPFVTLNTINNGVNVRTECSTITSPILTTSSIIDGTLSLENNPSEITVYVNGVSFGKTNTIYSGYWSLPISGLKENDLITAVSKAYGKSESYPGCNQVLVKSCVSKSSKPTTVSKLPLNKGVKISTASSIGSVVRLYDKSHKLVQISGLSLSNPYITKVANEVVSFECTTSGCFPAELYYATVQETGKCESDTYVFCDFATEGISESPVLYVTPSGVGKSISGSGINNSVVEVFVNDEYKGFAEVLTSSWTFNFDKNLSNCDVITLYQIEKNACRSLPLTYKISSRAIAPIVDDIKCVSTTGESVKVQGTVLYDYTTEVDVYINDIKSTSTFVTYNGVWQTGIFVKPGDFVYARAKNENYCLSESFFSSKKTIGMKDINIPSITSSLKQGDTQIIGTGAYNETITVYIDNLAIKTTLPIIVSNSGEWKVTGLSTELLKTGAKVTATSTGKFTCESLHSQAAYVSCVEPISNIVLSPSSIETCAGAEFSISLSTSQKDVVYQVYRGNPVLGGVFLGASQVGTGLSMTINNITSTLSGEIFILATNVYSKDCFSVIDTKVQYVALKAPNSNLVFSANNFCEGKNALVTLYKSEKDVLYTLRNNSDNTVVGTTLLGTGSDITIEIPLTKTMQFNMLAQHPTTECKSVNNVRPTAKMFDCSVNTIPIAKDDTYTVKEEYILYINPLDNDVSVSQLYISNILTYPTKGSLIKISDSRLQYVSKTDYYGTDFLIYEVSDRNVPSYSSQAVVFINITNDDDSPNALNDTFNLKEDAQIEGSIRINDLFLGDVPVTFTVLDDCKHGKLILSTDGWVKYTPVADFWGLDFFKYQVCDKDGDCSSATVYFDVSSVNYIPVANNDNYVINEDASLLKNIFSNDVGYGDGIKTFEVIYPQENVGELHVAKNGDLEYYPLINFNGSFSFTYSVCDNDDQCTQGTVKITINPVSDLPVASDDYFGTIPNVLFLGDVSINDYKSPEVPNTFVLKKDVLDGDLLFYSDGSFSFVLTNEIFETPLYGDFTFEYEICDKDNDCSTASCTINVKEDDFFPTAKNDNTPTINEDNISFGFVLDNDLDLLDVPITVTTIEYAENGTFILKNDGSFQYKPIPNFHGKDFAVYQICDADNDCSTATVFFTIEAENDEPSAMNDIFNVDEDIELKNNVLINDNGYGDGIKSITLIENPKYGSINLNNEGNFSYIPNKDFYGKDGFIYKLCDIHDECDNATVSIDVKSITDIAVAVDDSFNGTEESLLYGDVSSNDLGTNELGLVFKLDVNTYRGEILLQPNGEYVYEPLADFFGSDSFTYKICNSTNVCTDFATVLLSIENVNDKPIANNYIIASVLEDKGWSGSLKDNNTGLGDGGIIYSISKNAKFGTVKLLYDGFCTYTPNENYFGEDSFEYQVCDVDGECSGAIVYFTIVAVDDTVIAKNDIVPSFNEDTNATYNVSLNDEGFGDGGLVFSVSENPLHGQVDINSLTGVINYTPSANYNGTDGFKYKVCDKDNDCSIASVQLNIASVNDSPIANVDLFSTNEDTKLLGSVANNDILSGDGVHTFVVSTGVLHGVLEFQSNGSFTYTPTSKYSGTDMFVYQLCDSDPECVTAQVNLNISSVNHEPIAVNDVILPSDEDVKIFGNVSLNDSGLEDGGLSFEVTEIPKNGSVELNNSTGDFIFTPKPNYSGVDKFSYSVCDEDNDCDSAIVSLTVLSVNDSPEAVKDIIPAFNEDSNISGSVAFNDKGLGDGGISFTIVSFVKNGLVLLNEIDGSFTYTPNRNFFGKDSLLYRVCDISGDCSTTSVIFTILSVDDIPVAKNDTIAPIKEDASISGNLSKIVSGLGDGGIAYSVLKTVVNGSLIFNNTTGAYTYTPNANFYGSDSFTYKVCDADPDPDCAQANVNFTIESVDEFPVAVADVIPAFNEDGYVTADVIWNDTGLGDGGLNFNIVKNVTKGVLVFNPTTGNFTYTPTKNYFGTDFFDYQICDIDNNCSTARVSFTINEVDDVPVPTNDVIVPFNEDTFITGNVSLNDAGLGDGGIKYKIITSVLNGGVLLDSLTGSFTYTPNVNYFGTDNFEYQICDLDKDCASAKVSLTVLSVDDRVEARADTIPAFNEDGVKNGNVSLNDIGLGDGGLVFSIVENASNGVVLLNTTSGAFTYTPKPNFYGTDVFKYNVCDLDIDCSSASVLLFVNAINDKPVCKNDIFSLSEDGFLTNNVALNDDGLGDGGLKFLITKNVDNGVLNFNVSTGEFTYTPKANFFGTDNFVYSVYDMNKDSSFASVSFTILSVNDVPIAENDFISPFNEEGTASGSVAVNDLGMGDGGLKYTIKSNVANGVLNLNSSNGTFSYTPKPNHYGIDGFEYKVCDINIECDSAFVYLTVLSVDDNPIAVVDNFPPMLEDNTLNGNVSTNDIGLGDAPIVFSRVTDVSSGTLVFNTDGTFTYKPKQDYFGLDQFRYKVCDRDNQCKEENVNITINSVDDIPVAVNDNFMTAEGVSTTGSVGLNDIGKGDGGIVYSLLSSVSSGELIFNNGVFKYTPKPAFNGSVQFKYTICDSDGDCDTADVSIVVSSVDNMPVAIDDIINQFFEDASISGDVATNDSGLGDGGIVYSVVDYVDNGTLNLDAIGTFSFVPFTDYFGTDSFKYQVCDADGDCDTATVSFTIVPVNDDPLATVDMFPNLKEDQQFTLSLSNNDTGLGDGGIIYTISTPARNAVVTLQSNGTLLYVPKPNYFGLDSLQYKVCDKDMNCSSAWAFFSIESDNDQPLIPDFTLSSILEDSQLQISISSRVSGIGDGGIVFSIHQQSINGTVSISNIGDLTYIPRLDFYGTDNFTIKVCDVDNDCDFAIVTAIVEPVDDSPIAVNDTILSIFEKTTAAGNVQTNDKSLGDVPLYYTATSQATKGVFKLETSGVFEYTAFANVSGRDSVNYRVCDADGDCSVAKVFFTVVNLNDRPVVKGESVVINEDQLIEGFNLLSNDVDLDGDLIKLSTTAIVLPKNGTVKFFTDGLINYTPALNFYGKDSLQYQVCDNVIPNLCSLGWFNVTVNPVNDA
ncbi:MAG: tandem-95 repeat protein [Bacteroidales bacterium]|nr:tandem-95 repeat protein [Bacteroidales bacterium]